MRYIFTIAVVFVAACAQVPDLDYRVADPDFVDKEDFVRSPNDTSQYRSIRLDNGLEVLLVHNDFPRAGVALDLKVGSADNPPEFPGLAHFLEHMLFLGTQKYPQPEEYQTFITRNGGRYNASTGLDHTNYFFTIDGDKLGEGMDRLSQFFIAPLLDEVYVDKELEIVDSEFRRSLDNEGRGLYFTRARVYNPQNPASRFTAGNRESLLAQGRDALYAALRDFYQRYYRPGLMRLVVVGSQPLDTLQQMTEATFGAIAASPTIAVPERPPLYQNDSLPRLIAIESKSEIYSLRYSFPIPNQDQHRFSKPAGYVAHLLGHEAPGTLLAWLRSRNWASALAAGPSHIGESWTMQIAVTLTKDGNRHVPAIHQAVFAWIDRVREKAARESWRYREIQRMAEVNFRWRQPADPLQSAISLARSMHYVPVRRVFAANSLYSGFAPQQVQQIVDALTPQRVAISHIAPQQQTSQTEPIYGFRYRIDSLSSDFITPAKTAGVSGLHLPGPNPYIPDTLAIGRVTTSAPDRLDNDQVNSWLYQDSSFRVPLANIRLSINNKKLQHPVNRMLLQIYLDARRNHLEQKFYDARLAGLSFNMAIDSLRGLVVSAGGYTQHLGRLFDDLLHEAIDMELSPEAFARYREEMQIRIDNQRTRSATTRLYGRLASALFPDGWTREQQLETIQQLTYQDWLQLGEMFTTDAAERTMLIHGEIDRPTATAITNRVAMAFPSPATRIATPEILPIAGPKLLAEPVEPDQHNQVLMLVYGNLQKNPRNVVLSVLTGEYLTSPFFAFMRTENKLGYQAFVSSYLPLHTPHVIMLVESNVTEPPQLQEYYLRFFEMMRKRPPGDELFVQLRTATEKWLTEPELQLGGETARIWRELSRRNYRFDTRDQLLLELARITPDEFRAFVATIINPRSQPNWLWGYSGKSPRVSVE